MFDDTFSEDYVKTDDVINERIYFFKRGKKKIKIMIYLLSCEERWKNFRANFLKKVTCPIIVYDITNRESIENISSWLDELENSSKAREIILVGNKRDKDQDPEKKLITEQDLKNLRKSFPQFTFKAILECSAKDNMNVKQIFNVLGNLLYQKAFDDDGKEKKK